VAASSVQRQLGPCGGSEAAESEGQSERERLPLRCVGLLLHTTNNQNIESKAGGEVGRAQRTNTARTAMSVFASRQSAVRSRQQTTTDSRQCRM
jgi:hypothetical protein